MSAKSNTTQFGDSILQEAIASLLDSTGLKVSVSKVKSSRDKRHDAVIGIKEGKRTRYLAVEVKGQVNSDTLGSAIVSVSKNNKAGDPTALVTRYINPSQAQKLRELGVEFFDTAGNAFLREKGLYVFVSGRRTQDSKLPVRNARAFNPTGSRLVFALLCHPGLENKPYRDLAKAAGISLGAVDWIMTDLKSLGHLADRGARGRRLLNKKELLKRWVTAYPEQLRPKLLIGRYHKPGQRNWWDDVSLPPEAFWSGEVGAKWLTRYLSPQTVTIYSETSLPKLQAQYGLRRDANGEVELLRKFWRFDHWDERSLKVAPPLLVYADLVMTANDRNLETAEMIYDRHISRLVE
ncbi:MAG: hypothetical protein QOD75_2053 [Blastocatellia bacterium]|jgi:hypothetical protein|nr:hypothetical protein [Blastocatellia bacterium]